MTTRTDATVPEPMEIHMRKPPTLFRVPFAVAVAVVALTLTACGGDGDEDGSDVASLEGNTGDRDTDTTSTTLDPQEAMLAYARCMRGEGVHFPDPGSDGAFPYVRREPSEEAAVRAAAEVCREHLPGGGQISDEENLEMYENFLALAKCLRREGFDVPDPTNGPDGVKFRIPGGGPDASPELKAAVQACRDEIGHDDGPSGLPGG